MSERRDNIILRLGHLGCTEDVAALCDQNLERHWRHHLFIRNGHAWGPDARCGCGCGQSLATAVPAP